MRWCLHQLAWADAVNHIEVHWGNMVHCISLWSFKQGCSTWKGGDIMVPSHDWTYMVEGHLLISFRLVYHCLATSVLIPPPLITSSPHIVPVCHICYHLVVPTLYTTKVSSHGTLYLMMDYLLIITPMDLWPCLLMVHGHLLHSIPTSCCSWLMLLILVDDYQYYGPMWPLAKSSACCSSIATPLNFPLLPSLRELQKCTMSLSGLGQARVLEQGLSHITARYKLIF